MKPFVLLNCILLAATLSSCDGECKEETIKEVAWITSYVDDTKDTLVSYSILKNDFVYLSYMKEVNHFISIRNDNKTYSNRCAIVITYGESSKKYVSPYVEIIPNTTYTFTCFRKVNNASDFNFSVSISQLPKQIAMKKRIDTLKFKTLKVNSCEQYIEALKEKYRTIESLYTTKTASIKLDE